MKINCVLGCTRRIITSRSREVNLPLCSAPVRHFCSAGSSSGFLIETGMYWSSKGPLHWSGAGALGVGGRRRRRRHFSVFSFLTGLWGRQCWASQGCPAKGQKAVRETPGRCKKNVLDEGDTALEQMSRGTVKLLHLQILISQLDKALSTPT